MLPKNRRTFIIPTEIELEKRRWRVAWLRIFSNIPIRLDLNWTGLVIHTVPMSTVFKFSFRKGKSKLFCLGIVNLLGKGQYLTTKYHLNKIPSLDRYAGGMGIEINTGYSCYLSAARRRRGGFFSYWIWARGQRLVEWD